MPPEMTDLIFFLRLRPQELLAGGLCRQAEGPTAVQRPGPLSVEKVAKPLFRERLHEIFDSISREIVNKNFVRGVISEVHAPGNDVI